MLRVAGQGKPLRVVADQTCTPSYTADVAEAAATLLQTGNYGLHQITSGGACSWYEFAKAIFELAEVVADLTPIPGKEYPTPARRPSYSVLAPTVATLRPWREALSAYLTERKAKSC
jgi:dTDP-4-dehydrorhamnose reductase